MTLISTYIPTLSELRDIKKICLDNLSIAINEICDKGKELFLEMSLTKFVRITAVSTQLFEYNIFHNICKTKKVSRPNFCWYFCLGLHKYNLIIPFLSLGVDS